MSEFVKQTTTVNIYHAGILVYNLSASLRGRGWVQYFLFLRQIKFLDMIIVILIFFAPFLQLRARVDYVRSARSVQILYARLTL